MPAPESWERIEELFAAAAALDEPDRSRLLDDELGADRDLRAEIDSLLAAHEAAARFLERPVVAAAPAWIHGDEDRWLGRRLGPWRLDSRLGEGSMGTVYLGTRAAGDFPLRVAVKLADRVAGSPSLRRRFASERRILARLEHPGIARLLDGGASEEGVPYLVMELVAGTPIDRYCATEELGSATRLRLFLEVCEAVEHAHRSLVVHRDLKPEHIRVTAEGRVKLLDFGIAKLLEREPGNPGDELTRTGFWAVTPGYASPEQLRGEMVTTASDVYSLGVVLYRLLTGTLPREVTSLRPADLDRTFAADPRPPSVALRGAATPPPGLTRSLPADLDAVVLAALKGESELRYPGVEPFAADLRRVLSGHPVSARRPTLGYRLARSLSRHRWAAALATTALVALVAFSALTARQARDLGRERDRAQVEQIKAQEVASFLGDLLQQADPSRGGGLKVTVREALDQAAAGLKHRLGDQPSRRAILLLTLGSIYRHVGAYDQARPRLEEGLALFRQYFGADSPAAAAALWELGQWESEVGDLKASLRFHREALAIRKRTLPASDPSIRQSLDSLGRTLTWALHYQEAAGVYAESLRLYETQLPAGDPKLVGPMARLAGALAGLDRMDEALALADRCEKSLDESEAPALLPVHLNALANVRWLAGQDAAAEALYRRQLAVVEAKYGAQDVRTLAPRNDIAITELRQGRIAEATAGLESALTDARRLLGADSHVAVTTAGNLAEAYRDQGRLSESERLYRDIVDRFDAARDPRIRADALQGLATTLLAAGKPAAARPLLEETRTLLAGMLPPGHSGLAVVESLLGQCLFDLGERRAGDAALHEGWATLHRVLGDDHPLTRAAASRLAAAVP